MLLKNPLSEVSRVKIRIDKRLLKLSTKFYSKINF